MQHILVVDDDPTIREVVADLLEGEGYAVDTAADGAEALEKGQRNPPQALILDMMMPVMDGWTFLRERQKYACLATLPVIVLSAARSEGLQEVKCLGAHAFLAKPFDIDVLLALLDHMVSPP